MKDFLSIQGLFIYKTELHYIFILNPLQTQLLDITMVGDQDQANPVMTKQDI